MALKSEIVIELHILVKGEIKFSKMESNVDVMRSSP